MASVTPCFIWLMIFIVSGDPRDSLGTPHSDHGVIPAIFPERRPHSLGSERVRMGQAGGGGRLPLVLAWAGAHVMYGTARPDDPTWEGP